MGKNPEMGDVHFYLKVYFPPLQVTVEKRANGFERGYGLRGFRIKRRDHLPCLVHPSTPDVQANDLSIFGHDYDIAN